MMTEKGIANLSNDKRYGVERGSNKDDIFHDEISEFSLIQPQCYYHIVDIHDRPVSLDWMKTSDPDLRVTKGNYSIRYIPASDTRRNPKFPYVIGQDLVRIRVLVSGPAHWHRVCERIPELAWLERNSTLCKEMFRIAKMHPGAVLRFGIDYPRYCTMIEKKAEEQHIDIDHKPLVTYSYAHSVYEKYKDIKMAPIRTKQDYLEEIESAKLESEGEE